MNFAYEVRLHVMWVSQFSHTLATSITEGFLEKKLLLLHNDFSNIYDPFSSVFSEVLGDVCCLGFLRSYKIISKYELTGILFLCYCSTKIVAAVEAIEFMVR
jgi:hypothetical protein